MRANQKTHFYPNTVPSYLGDLEQALPSLSQNSFQEGAGGNQMHLKGIL